MVLFLAAALVIVPFGTAALAQTVIKTEEPGAAQMTYDVLCLRPIGMVGIVAGSAAFIVSLPFTLLSGTMGKAGQKMVADPFAFTFTRPVGSWQKTDTGY